MRSGVKRPNANRFECTFIELVEIGLITPGFQRICPSPRDGGVETISMIFNLKDNFGK
jgi:hypothetical protein